MPTCIATAASLSDRESNATALKKIQTHQQQSVANYMWNDICTICFTTVWFNETHHQNFNTCTINALNLVQQNITHDQHFENVSPDSGKSIVYILFISGISSSPDKLFIFRVVITWGGGAIITLLSISCFCCSYWCLTNRFFCWFSCLYDRDTKSLLYHWIERNY